MPNPACRGERQSPFSRERPNRFIGSHARPKIIYELLFNITSTKFSLSPLSD
jgi:hypothetical protein